MSIPSTIPDRPQSSWSEVRAHDHVMRYRRSGVGPAVLLLHPGEESGALWPELLHVLSSSFRVIVPDLPDDADDTAAWLADFLEGLGFARVAVLAADGFCLPALELALL